MESAHSPSCRSGWVWPARLERSIQFPVVARRFMLETAARVMRTCCHPMKPKSLSTIFLLAGFDPNIFNLLHCEMTFLRRRNEKILRRIKAERSSEENKFVLRSQINLRFLYWIFLSVVSHANPRTYGLLLGSLMPFGFINIRLGGNCGSNVCIGGGDCDLWRISGSFRVSFSILFLLDEPCDLPFVSCWPFRDRFHFIRRFWNWLREISS